MKGDAELKNAIKAFVTKGLGCQCPESVFDSIEFDGNTMVVGRRLMVRFKVVCKECPTPNELLEELKKGRKERDGLGLNRFRLVLVVDGGVKRLEACQRNADAVSAVSILTVNDDRVHLHVVPKDDVPKALMSRLH